MSASAYSARDRVRQFARFLGAKVSSQVDSGRYLRIATEIKGVNIVLWHAHETDWIGIEGTGSRPGSWREVLSGMEAELRAAGFQRHQKSESSHQTSSTFRKGRQPLPDGSFHPELKAIFNNAKRFVSEKLTKKK